MGVLDDYLVDPKLSLLDKNSYSGPGPSASTTSLARKTRQGRG